MATRPLLIDTCALIWISQNNALSRRATEALDAAPQAGTGVFVSPISAWELGMLVSKSRLRIDLPPIALYEDVRARFSIKETDLTAEILVASSFLPGQPHPDPFDRMIIATAKTLDLTILTRDRLILAYAASGHVSALAC